MNFPANNLVNGGVSPTVRVRGLRAEQAAPVHLLCRHCGVALAAANETGFCCAGCAYVFRLVHERGLEGYYRIRDAVVPPVDPAVFQSRDFAWLAARVPVAETAAGTPELTLAVQGISCAGCVWLIEKLFHEQPGALAIETDAATGRMRLRWAAGRFDAPAFARVLQSFNYLVGPPGVETGEPESRRLLRRVGLCAAFAMNLMLFSLPRYFGMEETFAYAGLFDTLALACATLSVLVGGSYFIGRALRALRHRALHIDLPIALGLGGAYAGSVFGWATGRAQFVYFDFVGAFILLMLVGRWAQTAAVERNRRRLLGAEAGPPTVDHLDAAGNATPLPAENLRAGDRFAMRPGHLVPVEAQLESPVAAFGTAWISGEAEPHTYRAGGRVPAGALSLGREPVRLRALQSWADSLLAQLLWPAARDVYRHRALERIVGGYLAVILGVAALAAVVWWLQTHDALRTGAVVTAVLVVSCPCAIGLAFPLADELAAVALRREGVFVREADLWPRLGRIRRIVFDKTGTLTLEAPKLKNPDTLAALGDSARAVLLALVRDSLHPVSQSLLENLLARASRSLAPAAGTVVDTPGFGVHLDTPEGHWTLGRAGWRGVAPTARHPIDDISGGDQATELACDGVVLARFIFEDEIRPGARAGIATLRARGFEVNILSGDHPAKVAAMAVALGLPGEVAVGSATPGDKAAWIRAHDRRDTLMLGDGANDSLAFAAAFACGTPVVHRGLLEDRADFYYLGRGLDGLDRMFAVNAARRRTQGWLLFFSVGYNTLALGLAVSGHMNPLLAAILMPLSSLISLAIVGARLMPGLTRSS